MRRALVAVGVVLAGLLMFRAGLAACGDKSLNAGGIRQQQLIAKRYPASILIYGPSTSRIAAAARELKLQRALRQVGHKYVEASTVAELEAALASGGFNIVMADVADVPDVQRRVGTSASRPAVVAIAFKLTKKEIKEAESRERFLVNVPSRMAQYLDTIHDAVKAVGASRKA